MNPYIVECEDCNRKYDYLDNVLGDYTECKGTMLDGHLLVGCPDCGQEIAIPQ